MARKASFLFLLAMYFLNIIKANAQENSFSITGQYRTRTELRYGYRTLASDSSTAAFFITQRARLIVDYNKDKVSTKISIQDSRTWGDVELKNDFASLQVNELWLELFIQKGFSIKLGRQELAYDDHRLLGNLDWANLTISHDAVLLKYTNENATIKWHLGAAFNQSGEPLFGTNYTLKNYKTLGFSWIKKELKSGQSLSGIVIVNGMTSTNANTKKLKATCTLGSIYNYDYKSVKALIGTYYQVGKTENNLNVNALMINAYAEKKIKKKSIGIGIDYLSGNKDNTINTESKTFNTLYATNHKFYGYMDYFINIPTDTKLRGLLNPYIKFSYALSKSAIFYFDLQKFMLANENNTALIKIAKNLGTEVDAILELKPSALINLQFGYSMMLATQNMEYIKGGKSNHYNGWAFVMLKVSPVFFKNEFKN
ncbi:MAG: alginate export family protein [Sediminibacterium sp.]|nr:alginate export family protein [Sediminibacterium sp.]